MGEMMLNFENLDEFIDITTNEIDHADFSFTKAFLSQYSILKNDNGVYSVEDVKKSGGLYHVYYHVKDEPFYFVVMINDDKQIEYTYVGNKVICCLVMREDKKDGWYFNHRFIDVEDKYRYEYKEKELRIYPEKEMIYGLDEQLESLLMPILCDIEALQDLSHWHGAYIQISIYQHVMKHEDILLEKTLLYDIRDSPLDVSLDMYPCGKEIKYE